jgi:hypothetical protein
MGYNLILWALAAIVIFAGLTIVRVGLLGQYRDRVGIVSLAPKGGGSPRWYHRGITVALGSFFVLLGTTVLILVANLLTKQI